MTRGPSRRCVGLRSCSARGMRSAVAGRTAMRVWRLAAFLEPVAIRPYAFPDRPGTRSSSRVRGVPSASRGVKSSIPVNCSGPRPPRLIGSSETWCHICSSTPSRFTPANRVSSSAITCNIGLFEDHSVFHVVPSCRAKPSTEACSR